MFRGALSCGRRLLGLRRARSAAVLLAVGALVGLVVVSVASATGGPSAASGVSPGVGPDPTAVPEYPAMQAAARARGSETSARQQAAAARIGVRRSRMLLAGESDAAALSPAEGAFASWMTSPLTGAVRLARGERLGRTVGAYEAVVTGRHGRGGVVISGAPIMGRTPDGRRAPVDLGVERMGGAYRPRSSAMAMSLPGFGLRSG